MTDIKIFENERFGTVRTLEEDGRTLFCGSDVAKALGYARPSEAISKHCKGTLKRRIGVQTGVKANGEPAVQQIEMLFIPEGDIYRLAARSELPGAEEFERWIFDEVLPSIRKHGLYATADTVDKMLADPDTAIRMLGEIKAEREKRRQLEYENARKDQIIADFEPIRQYVDTILESTGTMATSQIAADYDMSAKKLNQILHKAGIQRNVNGQWILYRKHMGKGYTKSVTFRFCHSDGRQDSKTQTQWTQKGRLMIHEVLKSHGICAVMDRGTI